MDSVDMATPTVDEALGRTSRNIDAIRAFLGVNQSDLGRVIGSDQTGISKRLKGQVRWAIPELERLARAFGCDLTQLLGSPSQIPWDDLRWKPASRPTAPKGTKARKAARTPGFFHNQPVAA